MSDFSDRPFVAGSLVGLRAFKIDSLGRLVGPSYGGIFKPGENVAECLKRESMFAPLMRQAIYSFPASSLVPIWADPVTTRCPCGCGMPISAVASEPSSHEMTVTIPPEPEKPKHVLGGINCTCGFYAYFDGNNDYKEPGNVAAIIEGYGVCTVGDRGFRATKARLVALVRPKAKVSPLLREYLSRNYPDVPMYATKAEAVAAHPLTPPAAQITPADEDFWTREVPR